MGSVYRLAVAPEERRHGLGTRLIAEAERVLRDLGARRVAVTVAGDDQRAAPFWESMAAGGWERDSCHPLREDPAVAARVISRQRARGDRSGPAVLRQGGRTLRRAGA